MSEIITCTAWDTAGKYSELIDESHKIVIGRNEYFSSRATPSLKTIRLERFELTDSGKIKTVHRYVHPDFKVQLVPLGSQ